MEWKFSGGSSLLFLAVIFSGLVLLLGSLALFGSDSSSGAPEVVREVQSLTR